MLRLIQTLALGAALVTLVTCIWRDYGFLAALPRVTIAYLATFFLGTLLVLCSRLLANATARSAAPAAAAVKTAPTRRRRDRATTPPPVDAPEPPAGPSPDAG